MSNAFRRWLLALFAGSLFLLQPILAAAGGGQLVNVQWLQENLKRDDVLVLDTSPGKLHAAGHIPGAVNVDVFSYGGREIPAAQKEKLIQSWGVDTGKKIVIYDEGGSYLATSLFFDLYYTGSRAKALSFSTGDLPSGRPRAAW